MVRLSEEQLIEEAKKKIRIFMNEAEDMTISKADFQKVYAEAEQFLAKYSFESLIINDLYSEFGGYAEDIKGYRESKEHVEESRKSLLKLVENAS